MKSCMVRSQYVRAGIDQQIHPRPQGLVEALDLAIGLGMMRRAVDEPNREHTQILPRLVKKREPG